jgi:hypothetical protein
VITYFGLACGPVWYTDAYGIDYGMLIITETHEQSVVASEE